MSEMDDLPRENASIDCGVLGGFVLLEADP